MAVASSSCKLYVYLFVISDMDVVNAFARAMDGSKYSILLFDNYGARGEIPEGFFLGMRRNVRTL
jgi:hypothetical protein|tara:strand:- start:30 stop:224 length:195 start_codon:yes stop_codon:yes gene_type:complete